MEIPAPLAVAAVQWSPSDDAAANRERAASFVAQAASAGASLVVLPEYSQFFYRDLAAFGPDAAERLDGPFVHTLREAAARAGVVVVAGLIESAADDVHNTVVAVSEHGMLAAYRKVHLYDAFGLRESEWLTAGDPEQQPVIEIDGHQVGIQTCYDLRFPESSRRLVDAGATTILIPSEWVRGPQKERQWTTLVTARAIENTAHVVAADHAPPVGAGCTMVVDPMGVTLAALGEQEGIAHASIDMQRTLDVRRVNPSLDNRRYRVHPA